MSISPRPRPLNSWGSPKHPCIRTSVAAASDRNQGPIPGPGLTTASISSSCGLGKGSGTGLRPRWPRRSIGARRFWIVAHLDHPGLPLLPRFKRPRTSLEPIFLGGRGLVLERDREIYSSGPPMIFDQSKRSTDPFHLLQSWLIERSHRDPLGYQLAMPSPFETRHGHRHGNSSPISPAVRTPRSVGSHPNWRLAGAKRSARAERVLNAF